MLTWKSDDDDDDAAGGTLACAPGVVCPSRGAPADGVDAPAGACPVLVDVWLAVGDACNPVEDVADASDPDPDNIAPVGGAPSASGAAPSVLILVIALLETGVLPEPGTLLEPGALLNATRKSVVVCVTSVGTVETNVVDDRTIVASVLRVTTASATHPIRPTFTSGRYGVLCTG
ncbi:Calcium-transporting ATPase 2 [Verticillium dahliae VDG2]|nr:Calcium-transporting ATPase 2 [Verticillium dahliae VDG2]